MGFGKKKSAEPAPAAPAPIATEVNDNRPDDEQKRGVPIADEAPAGSKPLLAPPDDDPRKRGGMLY